MTSTLTRAIAATGLALVVALGLAACSKSDADGTAAEKTPSAKPTVAAAVYNECVDGSLQIWDEDEPSEKAQRYADCAGAVVISGERTIELGSTQTLTIEGSGNTITLEDAESIVVLGNDNTVAYTGDAPKIDDQGTGNTVAPKS